MDLEWASTVELREGKRLREVLPAAKVSVLHVEKMMDGQGAIHLLHCQTDTACQQGARYGTNVTAARV